MLADPFTGEYLRPADLYWAFRLVSDGAFLVVGLGCAPRFVDDASALTGFESLPSDSFVMFLRKTEEKDFRRLPAVEEKVERRDVGVLRLSCSAGEGFGLASCV